MKKLLLMRVLNSITLCPPQVKSRRRAGGTPRQLMQHSATRNEARGSATSQHTSPERLGVLRYQPVPRLDVDQPEAREELPDDGDDLVGHVRAPRAPDEQRRLHEADRAGVLVGEVAHVVERLGERRERHAELPRVGAFGLVEVLEEELADW